MQWVRTKEGAGYVLQLSPNDHPTTAQWSLRAVGGHPKSIIFQPDHACVYQQKKRFVSLKKWHPTPTGADRVFIE